MIFPFYLKSLCKLYKNDLMLKVMDFQSNILLTILLHSIYELFQTILEHNHMGLIRYLHFF